MANVQPSIKKEIHMVRDDSFRLIGSLLVIAHRVPSAVLHSCLFNSIWYAIFFSWRAAPECNL